MMIVVIDVDDAGGDHVRAKTCGGEELNHEYQMSPLRRKQWLNLASATSNPGFSADAPSYHDHFSSKKSQLRAWQQSLKGSHSFIMRSPRRDQANS